MKKKKNMFKLFIALTMLLTVFGASAVANSAEDALSPINGRCVTDHNGNCVTSIPEGNSGRETTSNTRTRFWSTHNMRQHRPVGRIGNTEIRSISWGNPGTRHWTEWQNHASNASLSDSWETR